MLNGFTLACDDSEIGAVTVDVADRVMDTERVTGWLKVWMTVLLLDDVSTDDPP